jgi:hypothetical protein
LIELSAGLHAALILLARAYVFARELRCSPWDFSVEITSLREVGLTNTDLRWLVADGYIEHALETSDRSADKRSFQREGMFTFGDRSCVVLTDTGAALAASFSSADKRLDDSARGQAPVSHLTLPSDKRPSYDKDRRELCVGELIVKKFTQPSPSQETILTAFEEEGWPTHLDDPLPPKLGQPAKRRLHDTIQNLNRNQRIRAIRFRGHNNGLAVRWQFISLDLHPAGEWRMARMPLS